MADDIRDLMAGVISDESEIHWMIDSTSERLWIDNPKMVAEAIVAMLEKNGYQIVHKDEMGKTGNISSAISWYEDYRRGMSF